MPEYAGPYAGFLESRPDLPDHLVHPRARLTRNVRHLPRCPLRQQLRDDPQVLWQAGDDRGDIQPEVVIHNDLRTMGAAVIDQELQPPPLLRCQLRGTVAHNAEHETAGFAATGIKQRQAFQAVQEEILPEIFPVVPREPRTSNKTAGSDLGLLNQERVDCRHGSTSAGMASITMRNGSP